MSNVLENVQTESYICATHHAFIPFFCMHPEILTVRAPLNGDQLCVWRIAILASHFSFFLFNWVLSFCRFFLPRCCWSFVVLCKLVLFLSFLSFPVSSGLLYFSWEFFSLYLFIPEGSDSLVCISGFHPLPGWGPPQDNNVYSSRLWTLQTVDSVHRGWQQWRTLPPPFPSPTLQLAVRIGKLVAWESWAQNWTL